MTTALSNTLADRAEAIRSLLAASEAAATESVDKALEAGLALITAKAACAHGEWLPFLERVGIGERRAQRLIQLAESGLKSVHVSDLGGIRAALKFLSRRKLPTNGDGLVILAGDGDLAVIWPAKEGEGLWHVAVLLDIGTEDFICHWLDKPFPCEMQIPAQAPISFIWNFVEEHLRAAIGEWAFVPMPEDTFLRLAADINLISQLQQAETEAHEAREVAKGGAQ